MTNKVGQCAFHGKNIRQEDWLTAAAWPWQAFEAATVVIFEVVLHQKTHRELNKSIKNPNFGQFTITNIAFLDWTCW